MSTIVNTKKRTITVEEKMKVIKLKVKVGMMIYDGRILLIYESFADNKNDHVKQKKMLKSTEAGIIRSIGIKEGDVIFPGSDIIELEKECNHPTIIKELCAECGADLQNENSKEGGQVTRASVSMIHMVPELKVNEELAQILGRADMDRLLDGKKLVLLVDLDQTLIHTTNDNIPNNIKDVYHFQLYGPKSPWYHTRLRPGTHRFLERISEKYELHICTFGSRRYAHTIAGFLDPHGKFFSHRILSRDECFDANSKTANLKALFPCGENMVCIIDDREDVWDYAFNLIHVKPYHFFQHTGDIHAPPGLTKCENDDIKLGFDFSNFNQSKSKNIKTFDDEVESEPNDIYNLERSERQNNEKTYEKDNVNNDDKKNIIQANNNDSSMNIFESVTSDEVSDYSATLERIGDFVNNKDEGSSSKEDDELKLSLISDKAVPEQNAQVESAHFEEAAITVVNEAVNQNSTVCGLKKNVCATNGSKIDAVGNIIIEESDDYLLYLEEILKIIHSKYFERYGKGDQIPDLKQIVPETRSEVLQGMSICFSGIVPNRMKLEESPAYKIARSLGAKVTQNVESDTSHLVAVRVGTAKVHSVSKRKNIKLVTPDWLWTCAERWEKVDERLYPLKNTKLNVESRHPPAHCRSPDHLEQPPSCTYQTTGSISISKSSGFLYTINPLMSLSTEDIESMEGEVDDIFKESDGEADDSMNLNIDIDKVDSNEYSSAIEMKRKVEEYTGSSSDCRSSGQDENDFPSKKFAIKKKRKEISYNSINDCSKFDIINKTTDEKLDNNDYDNSVNSENETINDKFCRDEGLSSNLDLEYNTEDGNEEDQESDGEWNVMGAALEKEFLEDG